MTAQIPAFGTNDWFLDPSPWYEMMLQTTPIFLEARSNTWNVFTFADVERALTQFSIFSSDSGGYTRSSEENGSEDADIMGSMLTTDPPLHTKLRNIVSKSFSPTSISQMEPRVREIATGILNSASPNEGMDMITDFSDPFPVTVIAEMLGIPVADRKKFKKWSDNEIGSSDEPLATRSEMHRELATYLSKTIQERKKNPRSDLISSIVTSEVDGERLSEREAVSFCILLLIAGNETTTNLLANSIRLFSRHDSLSALHSNKSLIPSAVEEVLRYSSPVRGMFRIAVKDTEMSGKQIKAGQAVMAWIGAANRDGAKFPHPDKFDIERKPNPHIAFGHGIHMCIGAPLARLESKVAVELLAEKYSSVKLKVSEKQLEPLRNVAVAGVKHLPVKFAA
ncbi:MAG: cytochrome P450 [Nitrososphaerales archaeon]